MSPAPGSRLLNAVLWGEGKKHVKKKESHEDTGKPDTLHNQLKRNDISAASSKDEGGCLDDLPVDHRDEKNKKESLTHSLTVWWKFQGNFASLSTIFPTTFALTPCLLFSLSVIAIFLLRT